MSLFSQDPKGEIIKLAKFIDVQRSDADLDEIVKATSFDAMKKNSNPSSNVKMYRKGQCFEAVLTCK